MTLSNLGSKALAGVNNPNNSTQNNNDACAPAPQSEALDPTSSSSSSSGEHMFIESSPRPSISNVTQPSTSSTSPEFQSPITSQKIKSFTSTNIAATGCNPETNLSSSPNLMAADAVSTSASRPRTVGASMSATPKRASVLKSTPHVQPLLIPPYSPQSAGRALSIASMQRKPSLFYYRQYTASLPCQSPSQSEHNSMSAGSIERAGRIRTRRHFASRRLPLGYSGEKPWLSSQSPAEKFLRWIMVVSFVMGLAIFGVLIWVGTTEIQNYNYCTVLEDNFDTGSLNTTIWMHDVQVGAFGNGEFEWATSSSNNSFVRDGKLCYREDNMTKAGICTSAADSYCVITSNSTSGDMIPPVMSARLLTRNFANIRYGKVEVRAKLPQGDWLWPAIWMLPKDSVYGVSPASGEIDICESRGHDHTYPVGGVNVMSSTLHWGPAFGLDKYCKTTSGVRLTHSTFADGFHTFGLEWNQHYIMTYLDGHGSTVFDPWPAADSQAPFDQDFYLVLDVAVGGTNGWFPDDQADKPWSNGGRQMAMNSFWNARDKWQPTWGDESSRGMIVDSVKVYSMC
ncbi:concanavalin A-like lectin/glucanase domain-containing protein [Lipomyces starkeyi]